MSLRYLYIILFSSILCVVSLLSFFSIYFLYNNHRVTLFNSELKSEAKSFYDHYNDNQNTTDKSAKKLPLEFEDKRLVDKQIQIFNDSGLLIFSYPIAHTPIVNNSILTKIHQKIELNFQENKRDFYGLYAKEDKKSIFISAFDKEGLNKLNQLKFILAIVFILTQILAIIFANFFILKAIKPLLHLNNQISETTINNLTKPVDVGNTNSEVSKIAKNYNQMLERLNDAFKTQNNFVQHASHELRTPLATMYATTQAALKNKELKIEDYHTILNSLKDEQNNLIELTNALLLLSQYEKLQHKPQWQPVRIDELLYEAMSYCKKLFNGITIDFKFESIPEDENHLIIKANETLINSVFTNLTKNAFLYSEDKKINIVLVATDTITEIHFENNGRHLTETEIQNIKEPLTTSDNVGRVKGFGLGLSIVQKIINIHNAKFIYTPVSYNKNRFTIKFK